jgi:diguanylate cyclase (GGDEF)-like protein
MESSATLSALASIPSAFAAACRHARTDSELFERCREALVRRFGSEKIWFSVTTPGTSMALLPPPDWVAAGAVEVVRLSSGQTEFAILAEPSVSGELRQHATPIALGLSVMLELHGVLRERQGQLDDAVFQLRALRQVARLLSSVHSAEETENLILDFMAEVFFCWWACLYRPLGDIYVPKVVRSLKGSMSLNPIDRSAMDQAMPPDTPVTTTQDAGVAKLFPATAQVIVSLDAGVERLAVMALGPRLHDQAFGPAECDLAGTLAFAAAIALKNAQLVEQLQSAASTDPLTGLSNRRAMEERLGAELSRTKRHQIRTSVVMLDVDRFKLVNDTLGHAAGDRSLRVIGERISACMRESDIVARLGGDEFVALIENLGASAGLDQLAQKIIDAMAQPLQLEHGELVLSVSIGVAVWPKDGRDAPTLMRNADAALYRAKNEGRNRFSFYARQAGPLAEVSAES